MEFLKAKGRKIYEGDHPILLRGFGLGGWFLPEGYMWKLYTLCDRPRRMEAMIEKLCGKEYADRFWQQYLDSYITKQDMKWIAEEGFNSVRLPLNARHLYERKGRELILCQDMLARIDQIISWCREYKLYVILDMHGAPGGQTGQNIDDSEADQPMLFMNRRYEEELVFLWKALAEHYKEEPVVAGYDLLNEPVPVFHNQHQDKVLPLYRKLIREIRAIDPIHMIILEGVHWATDFSIFDPFTREEASDNILLQFHKYWNNPDQESMKEALALSERLDVPSYMGEGGENNCDWYTTAFPLYEKLDIGWSFWSYKKMACTNSPVTFAGPEGWELLLDWIDGKCDLEQNHAISIFDEFLQNIQKPHVNRPVLHALKRETPVKIPCEAYQEYRVTSRRVHGAELRLEEPVSIVFENGRTGKVNYQRMGGEEQPPEENLLVQLMAGDSVSYLFRSSLPKLEATLSARGHGELRLLLNGQEEGLHIEGKQDYRVVMTYEPAKENDLWIICNSGVVFLDDLTLV